MKERTFYTINLDVKRISILVSVFLLLIVYSFILGHTLGKRKAEKEWREESESSAPKDRESRKPKDPPPPKEPEQQLQPTISEPVKSDPPPLEEEIPETPDFTQTKPKKPKKEKPVPSEKKMGG